MMLTKHVTIRDHRASDGGFELTIDGHDIGGVVAYKVEADCRETEIYYPRVTVELLPCSLTLDLHEPIEATAHGD